MICRRVKRNLPSVILPQSRGFARLLRMRSVVVDYPIRLQSAASMPAMAQISSLSEVSR